MSAPPTRDDIFAIFATSIVAFSHQMSKSNLPIPQAAWGFVHNGILENTDFGKEICRELGSDDALYKYNQWREGFARLEGDVVVVGDSKQKGKGGSSKTASFESSQASRVSDLERSLADMTVELSKRDDKINRYRSFIESKTSYRDAYLTYRERTRNQPVSRTKGTN